MNSNDEKIIALKEKISKKKEELAKSNGRFVPTTNCSIEFRGTRYNINTFNFDQCVNLMVELNALHMSAENLGVTLEISGYDVKDWISDLKNKCAVLSIKNEEKKLKRMEMQLEKLLSEDKKTELEIEKIAQSLGI